MKEDKFSPGRIAIPILISLGGLLITLLISYLLRNHILSYWEVSPYELVNFTFTMQMMELLVSFIVLLLMFFYDRHAFVTFFRAGFSSDQQHSWNLYGLMVLIPFTLGTTLFMSTSVISQNGSLNETFFRLLPLVLLLAATNAWSEEIFTRFTIVAGLHGKVNPIVICWISAAIFGIPHIVGTPSGIFGVIMSGFLGWLLARSVIETKGMGWALSIHFAQDVVIFGAGAMILAGQN